MSIETDLEAALAGGVVDAQSCMTCQYLEAMTESERKAAERGISGRIPAPGMAEILTKNGWPISRSGIIRHRRHLAKDNA